MLVRTDDEIYRVDSVWLGPPRATFPWRARYVSYGLGLILMIIVMWVQRRIGIGLDFFSVAWALILTVVSTRLLGQRINDERPLGAVLALFRHEVTGPRQKTADRGGPVRSSHVRISRPGRRRPAVAQAAWSRSGQGRSDPPRRTRARPDRARVDRTRAARVDPQRTRADPERVRSARDRRDRDRRKGTGRAAT